MNNEISLDGSLFSSLKGKVVVLTGKVSLLACKVSCLRKVGGASGIGAAAVRLFNAIGAYVVFGDLDSTNAEAVLSSLGSDTSDVTFVQTDVTSYAANLNLFQTAYRLYGRIDHAISVAGISEIEQWFDPSSTPTDVEREPNTVTLDVNLKGALYFVRIAMAYLKEAKHDSDRSLTLFSSLAGFTGAPSLGVYTVCLNSKIELRLSISGCKTWRSWIDENIQGKSMLLSSS